MFEKKMHHYIICHLSIAAPSRIYTYIYTKENPQKSQICNLIFTNQLQPNFFFLVPDVFNSIKSRLVNEEMYTSLYRKFEENVW